MSLLSRLPPPRQHVDDLDAHARACPKLSGRACSRRGFHRRHPARRHHCLLPDRVLRHVASLTPCLASTLCFRRLSAMPGADLTCAARAALLAPACCHVRSAELEPWGAGSSSWRDVLEDLCSETPKAVPFFARPNFDNESAPPPPHATHHIVLSSPVLSPPSRCLCSPGVLSLLTCRVPRAALQRGTCQPAPSTAPSRTSPRAASRKLASSTPSSASSRPASTSMRCLSAPASSLCEASDRAERLSVGVQVELRQLAGMLKGARPPPSLSCPSHAL
eukprot:557359-Rhodomonas_salina.2